MGGHCGSDEDGMQWMPKVAHVHSRSRQGVKTCETFGERKKCPQKFLPGEYLLICDKCAVVARIYKFAFKI